MEKVSSSDTPVQEAIASQRREFLEQLEDILETPMLVLGFVWLALLVVELVWGLSPLLEAGSNLIWGLFLLDFFLRLVLAPGKGSFLKANWLTGLSLLLPALRVLRISRVVRLLQLSRTTRGLQLFRLISSLNRGMRGLRATLGRRGFAYVSLLTLLVCLGGAAGMYLFERDLPDGRGFSHFGEALWWTAMLMTTIGSEYWPQTPEGRLLCLLLSIFSLGVLSYLAATLATFFLGQDAADPKAEVAGNDALEALRAEIAALRAELATRQPPSQDDAGQ